MNFKFWKTESWKKFRDSNYWKYGKRIAIAIWFVLFLGLPEYLNRASTNGGVSVWIALASYTVGLLPIFYALRKQIRDICIEARDEFREWRRKMGSMGNIEDGAGGSDEAASDKRRYYYPISPGLTIATGILLVAALALLSFVLLDLNIWTEAGTATAFVAFGLIGFRSAIDVGHVGVILLLGKRIKYIVLDEGYHWLLPSPIMSIKPVDVREFTIDIPMHNVPAIGALIGEDAIKIENGDKVAREEKTVVEMEIDVTLQLQIVNPHLWLNITESTRAQGVRELAESVTRDFAKSHSDITIMESKEKIAERIEKAFDKTSEIRWGIDAKQAFVPRVTPRDPSLMRVYEQLTKEQRERAAERLQNRHYIDEVKKMSSELDVSSSEAAIWFGNERGKVERREITISGTAGESPLVKAAGLFLEGIEKMGGKK